VSWKDGGGSTVKSWVGTANTNGNLSTSVSTSTTGADLPQGGVQPQFDITNAAPHASLSQRQCMGTTPEPPPCGSCAGDCPPEE
jgi:hypothetical protein